MNLTARETKENRNDFLKEIKLNEKIVTYIKCHSLSFSASRFVRFAFEIDARIFWKTLLSLKNFGKMDGNAAEYNIVGKTCASFSFLSPIYGSTGLRVYGSGYGGGFWTTLSKLEGLPFDTGITLIS